MIDFSFFVNKIKNKLKILVYGVPLSKQELLIRKALIEKGFNIKNLKILCDHDLGLNYVNGVKMGIKYPDSFYTKSVELIPKNKTYNFYFNGNMNENGNRFTLLKPFKKFERTALIPSNEGRIQSKKDQFNIEYFTEMAKSKFGLCPHQADWPGDKEAMWTYRFIESCFVEAIPVLFKDAPLGKTFTKGFYFLWDYELLKLDNIDSFDLSKSKSNKELAREVFCISEKEVNLIKASFTN